MFSDLVSIALLWLLMLGLLVLTLKLALYFWRITFSAGLLMLGLVCWQEPRAFFLVLFLVAYVFIFGKVRSLLTDKNNPC